MGLGLKNLQTTLSALLSLLPDQSSDLLSQIDQPLQVLCDEDSGKEFILCEYNRDADSYRSPWSNKFHPHLEDGMYYEGGISSVYLWEEDDNEGFVACFLIKKGGARRGRNGSLLFNKYYNAVIDYR
nr:probable F-actin-capping protein subunit beta [Tanacetum cinerariifolium]